MITLTVLSHNGSPLVQPLSADFDELGGSIGRADTNRLVLPDPQREISRQHASVVYRNGGYALLDSGSNPVLVNGAPVGNGREVPIRLGDEITIGGYLLRVDEPARDPFTSLGFGPTGLGVGKAAAVRSDGVAPGGGIRASVPPASPSRIPDDWDPFGAEPPRPVVSVSAVPPAGLADLGRREESSLDALFGLGSGGGDLLGELDRTLGLGTGPNTARSDDPLLSLTAVTAATPAGAVADHASVLSEAFRPPIAVRDEAHPAGVSANGSSGGAAASPSSAPPLPSAPFTPIPPTQHPAPADAVLSWGEGGDARTVIRSRGAAPSLPPAPMTGALPEDFLTDVGGPAISPAAFAAQPAAPLVAEAGGPSGDFDLKAIPASPAIGPARLPPSPPVPSNEAGNPTRSIVSAPPAAAADASPVAHPAPPSATDPLLDALRAGLGLSDLPAALTPEVMHLLGSLVREATSGTLDLLAARAVLKREFRAEVTMIVTRDNNPLKFSPSVDVALGHLLRPPAHGFMPVVDAMRDAQNDLRAHQFGVVAGMRAALEGVLARFDPAALEARIVQKSRLGALLPSTRKAQLWELFQQLYSQLSTEAADDFNALFGKAFLRAYESHSDELADARRKDAK
ncbi:type VI secretion system-associated FHA domain protein TagH [Derxia gummosa]|uniref:Type VI secretion system-associated FHA domain protein TagH n=1 Tax=Derxia gummosa DSM 723 TaxID=1121388 RepID=A0A9U5GQP1_9BURK|nr:type VI secretion system-associated FHA domain protein TagH [Derxia gummosa]